MVRTTFSERAKVLLIPLTALFISWYYRVHVNPPKRRMYEKNPVPGLRQHHPYIRSSLATQLYDRMVIDDYLKTLNKSQWYDVDLSKTPDNLKQKFVHVDVDDETKEFLDECSEMSDSVFLQLWHNIAKLILNFVMTQTSINGLLNRGSMFVFSKQQFASLVGSELSPDFTAENVLDIGAGDGAVTNIFAHHFSNVFVTETSTPMRWRLKSRGYLLLDVDAWGVDGKYDMITILNVLDRCAEPLTMLKTAKTSLKPSGLLIVALVLPFRPYVEFGGVKNKPIETVDIQGSKFEDQLSDIQTELFNKSGFEIVSWTKTPYLCQGDMKQAFYWLNDAVFLLKPI